MATPREVGERADVVISMVVDGGQVEAVLLGEDGASAGAGRGALFVDMSTIAPADARSIGATLAERGQAFLDAPVTGSSPRAEAGTLTIMVGGAAEDVARARPLFEAMGERVVHAGERGHGQLVKVIANSVAAVNCATVAQALVVGRATGADLGALTEVMGTGSAGSAMLALKGPSMLDHDFATQFKLEHMVKDLRLCLAETTGTGVPFPFAGEAAELYAAGIGHGLGERDFCAVLEVLEKLAAVRV